MRLFKKTLDERQELEVLRVRNVCSYVLYFGTVISILVQVIFLLSDLKQVAGECVVLILAFLISLVGHVKKGNLIYTKPSVKVYLRFSIFTAVLGFFTAVLVLYFRTPFSKEKILKSSFTIMGITFVVCYSFLALMGYIIKKRRIKLEKGYQDNE